MLRDIETLLQHGRSWVTLPIAHYLAGNFGNTVLASFPRSGSTWLRTMLTHLIVNNYDSNPEVFNRRIPSITLSRVPLMLQTKPKLCSTHGLYTRNIKSAIYLVRDPRCAIVSLYRYTTAYVGKEMPVRDWARLYMCGFYGPRWDQHVHSWLGNGVNRLHDRLLVISYETMRKQPEEMLDRAATFLGFPYDKGRLGNAVQLSSPSVMKQWEEQILGGKRESNASFYRVGKVDEWATLFAGGIGEKILNQARAAICLAGYAGQEEP